MEQGLPVLDSTFRVFVGNMSPETTEDQLRTIVGRFGAVKNVYLVKVMNTGQSRGFAFVEMGDQHAADRTIAGLNGVEIDGRCLKVRLGF